MQRRECYCLNCERYEAQAHLIREEFNDIGLLGNRERRLERFCDYLGVKAIVAYCGGIRYEVIAKGDTALFLCFPSSARHTIEA